jgi:hypothetical protein
MSFAELARRALLGTRAESTPLSTPTGQAELDAALSRLVQPESPAGSLLRQATLLILAERAGRVPECPTLPPVEPCPDDTTPPLPKRAEASLRRVLNGFLPQLTAPLLEATAAHGYRVPPALLPALLEWGKQGQNRPYVRAVACRKAHWLAAHNADWRYLVDPARADAAFETGTPTERREALRQLRAEDPASALQRLQASWKKEPPTERAGLIEALAEGLSQADEPFLESVLDDRRKEVRLAAAKLLARLPESRLVARMRERLAACLKVVDSQLVLELPAACDAAMERDGIPLKPEIWGIGERSFWLMLMLACVPPVQLCQTLDVSETHRRELCGKHEFSFILKMGGAWAAANFGDTRLAALWLADLLDRNEWDANVLSRMSPGLKGARELESVVMRALRRQRADVVKILLPLLPAPWSNEFSLAIMQHVQTSAGNWWTVREYVECALTHLPADPELLLTLEKLFESIQSDYRKPIKDFLQAFEMRIKFIQALEKP